MIPKRTSGAALIIVLAFVVLLTGLVVAYFSRTGVDRQLAKAGSNDALADLLARSALDIVVSDFKAEILNGGAVTTLNVVPQRSPKPAAGATAAIPNLIRRSVRSDAVSAPAVGSHASAVNSTSDVATNGRFVSLARWNSHYLVPKLNTGDNNSDPITTGFNPPQFWAPDWVIVTRDGPTVFDTWNSALANALPTNSSYAVGRYAFAVYDEGGLLDFNVAGYPYPAAAPTPAPLIANIGRKGVLAFADLTGMRLTSSNSSTPNSATVTKMIAWRNYATLQASGTYPNLTSPDSAATAFVNYVLTPGRDFRTVNTATFNSRTDQALVTRRELIELFRSTTNASFNMLQFLGTFSRERNVPTWNSGATLSQRFYIGNLSLVRPNPGAAQSADIQTYFGLQWIPGTPGTVGPPLTPAIPGHWRYVGSSGTIMRDRIPAFATTPEFFQLLNYAMNLTNTDDAVHIGTTLSIGAALIDQYDDNTAADPVTGTTHTMIEYNGGWALGLENSDPARPSPSPAPSPFPSPAGMSPTPPPFVSGYAMLNRPFRNVGEFGYAFRTSAAPSPTPVVPKTLDFITATSPDAPILDLFTYNNAILRAGVVNLNTQSAGVLSAILQSATTDESASTFVGQTDAVSNHAKTAYAAVIPMLSNAVAGKEGTSVKSLVGRQELTRTAAAAGTAIGVSEEAMETATRALAEVGQIRTWGLLIDVIAQSGRYPPAAANLADFVVEAEKRYWLHIAIDRFTGQIVDQQLEAISDDR